uniref:Uncharacterized protein n=1 Tax=Arion vulgaris TaxID=1028688 RepID=A0A0B7BSI5_9EUPU
MGRILQRPAKEARHQSQPDIDPTAKDLAIDCNKPRKAEIKKAILQLQNAKATSPDGIPAEEHKGKC